MKQLQRSGVLCALTVLAAGVLCNAASAQAGGGKIVFESWEAVNTSADSRSRVGVMNADGSNATNLTNTANNKFDDWNPSFNRTGSKIVFMSDRTGTDEVYVMNADGTNQVRLTKNSSNKPPLAISEPTFSPDSARILFSAIPINVPNATWEVYLMNADGSGLTKLTNSIPGTGGALGAIFAPDGSKILFERTDPVTFAQELCEMNPDGSGFTLLTSLGGSSFGFPSFSPDGSKIVAGLNGDIVLMNADGTGLTVLFSNGGFSGSPVFSPDGTKIAFAIDAGGTDEVFTMNLDGTGLTQLTFGPGISPPSSIEANDPGSWAPGSVGVASLATFSLNPARVSPGSPSQGTVSLTQAAPAGGAVVTLTSSSTSASVPAGVTIPAGATSATFPIATASVTTLTPAPLTATYQGVSRSATLTIDPAQQAGSLIITKAEYTVSQQQLQVQVTGAGPSDTLNLYVTSTEALIGPLTPVGGNTYQIKTTWPVNPVNVTVKSGLSGSASLNVTAK